VGKWWWRLSEPKPHERVNDILLGPLERPALAWLSAHMPAWVTPDILTGIGTLGAGLIFIGYGLSNMSPSFLWFVILGVVINWFGDSLDGTLARFRKIERPRYGFFIDHTVDAFNEFLILIGLGLSPYVRFEIACLALIGYLLMSVLVYIRTYIDGVFKISYGRLGPTEVRVILIALTLSMFYTGFPALSTRFGLFTIYDICVGAIAALLILIFIGSSVQQAKTLSQLE
jgi:phosphatidylglycerophosphate synthase